MDGSAKERTPKDMCEPITLRGGTHPGEAHATARLENQPDLGQHHDRSETDKVVGGPSPGKRPALAVLPGCCDQPPHLRGDQGSGGVRHRIAMTGGDRKVRTLMLMMMGVAAVMLVAIAVIPAVKDRVRGVCSRQDAYRDALMVMR